MRRGHDQLAAAVSGMATTGGLLHDFVGPVAAARQVLGRAEATVGLVGWQQQRGGVLVVWHLVLQVPDNIRAAAALVAWLLSRRAGHAWALALFAEL